MECVYAQALITHECTQPTATAVHSTDATDALEHSHVHVQAVHIRATYARPYIHTYIKQRNDDYSSALCASHQLTRRKIAEAPTVHSRTIALGSRSSSSSSSNATIIVYIISSILRSPRRLPSLSLFAISPERNKQNTRRRSAAAVYLAHYRTDIRAE